MDERTSFNTNLFFFFSYTVTSLFHQQNFLNNRLNVFKDIDFIKRLCALKFFPVRGFSPLTFMERQRTFWFHFDRKTEMARSGFKTGPVGKACLSLTWVGIDKSQESQLSPGFQRQSFAGSLPVSQGGFSPYSVLSLDASLTQLSSPSGLISLF